jgi:hypothetical protein
MCAHTRIFVSLSYYIHVCSGERLKEPQAVHVSSFYYVCSHATIYVSLYYYICVLILLYMCVLM